MKKTTLFTIILILVAAGLGLASAVLLQSLLGVIVSLGFIAFCVCSFYVKFVQKRKSQYPLVPPEGKPDMYVPRTNIPRPVVEDFRRLEEKKRKFAKIRKLVSKRVQRSKK